VQRREPVHAVVVNWNAAGETLGCLESLGAIRPPLAAIHVVDNASSDDSVARILVAHPEVRVHRNARNEGFAGGVNPGIRAALEAGAAWVLLMNNDARCETDAIERLLGAAGARPEAGLIGGKIYRDRGRNVLWCCGVKLGWGPNLGRLRGFDQVDDGRFDRAEIVDSLTGCGLLVKREVFERVGLFDEEYFAYVEDADFALRAREAGYRCAYEPAAVFVHPGGGSTGGGYSPGRKYLTAHGAARFLKRHGSPGLWAGFILFDVVLWPVLFGLALVRGRAGGAWAKLRGTLDGLRGRAPDLSYLGKRS
jgi:GT2 family glycosyltransferase